MRLPLILHHMLLFIVIISFNLFTNSNTSYVDVNYPMLL